MRFRLIVLLSICSLTSPILAEEELTLENAKRPTGNSGEEPLAKDFSLKAAIKFLDQASLNWTSSRKCFTCHTNYAYLMARPTYSAQGKAHAQVRSALEDLVEKRWPKSGPRWDAEVVMSAATLAANDAATSGQLHATTEKALARMWTVQRDDGGFDWLKCGWPPMESDDDYGIAIALIATYSAPGDYAKRPAAVAGVNKLKSFLQQNPPPTLHHRAMLLWAESYGADVLSQSVRAMTKEQLLKLQRPDGGWAAPALGDWKRADGKPQDPNVSDGYATGFTVYVLRRAGIPADDTRLKKGIAWLKANQRESGRWYTRSLNKDSKHFLSHAGSAMAVMAIQACETGKR